MSRRLLFAVPAVAAALLGSVSGARADRGASLSLESLVPDRSLAFLSLEEVGSWGTKFEATALGKLCADPEVKAFWDPVREDLKKALKGEGDGPAPQPAPDPTERRRGFEIPPIAGQVVEQLKGLKGQVGVALVDV